MPKFTKAERQYIKGIVHNYSLQRWSDRDIVDYLHNEKKIDLTKSMISKIRNQVVEEAVDWYLELRESGSKYVAVYKERLDSLLSYQKKLHDIISVSEKPEVQVRAISELHSIEMSVFSLFKELPQFEIRPEIEQEQEPQHCYCHSCLPGIGGEGAGPIVEQPPISNEPQPEPITISSLSSPIEEQIETEIEEEESEESEADRYWRNHPSIKSNNNNNNKIKFVVE